MRVHARCARGKVVTSGDISELEKFGAYLGAVAVAQTPAEHAQAFADVFGEVVYEEPAEAREAEDAGGEP